MCVATARPYRVLSIELHRKSDTPFGMPCSSFNGSETVPDLMHYRIWKRVFDIVLSSAVLVLVAPLMAVIAIAIKLDSPGPVFFVQLRVGQHGIPFRYVKFRTTRSIVGRHLRTMALDELPVLINVLRGDMSIVGPRAAAPSEVELYFASQRSRLDVKPGVTGYALVFGPAGGDRMTEIEMDLEYVAKYSMVLDLQVILRTTYLCIWGPA
jgi:lipopolysaccharide/colanic/teichoic acid biosynthesis glycosyltransferase